MIIKPYGVWVNQVKHMQVARKLSQIAQQNKKNQEMVSIYRDGRHIMSNTRRKCDEYISSVGGTFEIRPYEDPLEKLHKKAQWQAHQYVKYVFKRAEEMAKKGYGSCVIKIDRTYDLFSTDEQRNSCYSAEFVCKLLSQEGFKFGNEYEDYYDAFSNTIIWNENLPTSDEKIGMCWSN